MLKFLSASRENMKKLLASVVSLSVALTLSACSANKDNYTAQEETPPASSEKKISAEATEETAYTTPIDLSEGGWHYIQGTDPIETVRSAIENEANKSYTEYVEFITAQIDEEGTEWYLNKRIIEAGFADTPINSKTDKTYNDVNIALVNVEYHAEYDGTRVPFMDGHLRETFYLWQDKDTELWTIFDNMSPIPFVMEEWEGCISKEASRNGEYLPTPIEWEPEYEGEIYTSAYWIYEPSDDPVSVVKSAIENQAEKDFTLAVSFSSAQTDPEETEKYSQRRKDSELAQRWNISGEMFDSGRVIAVYAKYHVNYDPSATYLEDGDCGQYFYLWQDEKSLEWHIFESSYNHMGKGHEILWGVYS